MYTKEEIIENIKNIDLKLNEGLTGSRLGTGQTEHQLNLSTAQLKKQRDYWMRWLNRVCPATYRALFGPSVIKFKGRKCGWN